MTLKTNKHTCKTKAEEVGRKPAKFYCQSSIFSLLVFPEASCVKSVWMLPLPELVIYESLPSCHCQGRHMVMVQTSVNTFPLEITWCLFLWQANYCYVPVAVYHLFTLMAASNFWQTCFPVFIQFLHLWSGGFMTETDLSRYYCFNCEFYVHLLHIFWCKMMCLCSNNDKSSHWIGSKIKRAKSYMSHKANMWSSFATLTFTQIFVTTEVLL